MVQILELFTARCQIASVQANL